MEKMLISREECKTIQMSILDAVVKICEEHHFQYYLAYGTLLGAIRHEGYIPWDDDIDIYMCREDYDKLISVMKTGRYADSSWMKILDLDTEGYYYPFAKAVDIRTDAKMDSNVTKHGIWVDIFPVDNVPDNRKLGELYCDYCRFLRAIIIAMTTDFKSEKMVKPKKHKIILNSFAQLVGKRRMALFCDKECKKFSSKHTKYAACLFGAYGKKERMSKEVLLTPGVVHFEGKNYTGTAKFDEYLRTLYGDYMQLPPAEKRITHGVTATYIGDIKN